MRVRTRVSVPAGAVADAGDRASPCLSLQVVHFSNPKVQASIQANTYVVSGVNQTKKISDMLPGIISQMGPEGLGHLQKMAAAMGMKMPGAPAAGGDDDDVPEIAGDFEDAAKDDDDDVPELV